MPTIILLASDHNCNNAGAAAFYLANAFGNDCKIKLYNYLNRHLYNYNLGWRGFTDKGSIAQPTLVTRVKGGLALDENTQPISSTTFTNLGQMTKLKDNKNVFKPGSLSQLAANAKTIIDALVNGGEGAVCFVIAPNGRNLPSRLLTFGHKLSHGNDHYTYTAKKGATTDATDLLKMTNDQVLATMVEMALCQAIVANGQARYLGNCYGSQVMWVALGGGLNTYKRISGVQHDHNMVMARDGYNPQVSWEDGIFLGNGNNTDHPTTVVDAYTLFGGHGGPDITYNTDFHHSYMMIGSEATSGFSTLEHDLSGGIKSYNLGTEPQKHLDRVQRYSQQNWVGVYRAHDRIFGFQGHPIYHVTQYSAAWDGQTSVDSGPQTARNQHYQATKEMVGRCMFGD